MCIDDMSNYAKMLACCKAYEKKYGKIDFIESDNEWWLEMDAKLREAMGIKTGFWPEEMEHIKAKSAMKDCFQKGGAKTMRYILLEGPSDLKKAQNFIAEVGWPVFVKPNIGVGANESFALQNEKELEKFLAKKLPEVYIMASAVTLRSSKS